MHELEKYGTLSDFADALGVSIPRVKRLIEVIGVDTHRVGGAVFVARSDLRDLKLALKKKLIKRGRPSKKEGPVKSPR